MADISIYAIYTTFGTEGATFNIANNKTSTDAVGTSNQNLLIDPYSENYSYVELPLYSAASGQRISNHEVLSYATFQPVFKFEIPFDKFKTINTATIRFDKNRLTNLAHYSDEPLPDTFNIRVATEFKRYPPSDILTLPSLGSFSNASGLEEIIIPNAVDYITGYNFYVIFSQVACENNIQSFPDPNGGDANLLVTAFQYVELTIDYEPRDINESIGFRHFELNDSGLIERSPDGSEAIFPNDSGFIKIAGKEKVGCGVLFTGSGYQLRNYGITCAQRVLEFNNLNTTEIKEVELIVPQEFQGSIIDVYRWNTLPNPENLDFNLVGTLPMAGGNIALRIEPGKIWFHFGQYRVDHEQVRPIRLDEINGKLVSIGF